MRIDRRLARCLAAGVLVAALSGASRASAACGDGLLDGSEACDDGNVRAGDGCSPTCSLEAGFECVPGAAVTVANGGFETPGIQRFNVSDGYIPGWTIAEGTLVDYLRNGTWTCSGGSIGCVDLSGTPSRGILYQDLATTPGAVYTVHFRMAANCTSTCSKRAYVSVADGPGAPYATALFTATVPILGTGITAYTPAQFTFTARTTTTRLAFTATELSDAGMFVDDVSIPSTVCRSVLCGNGTLDAGETCDDGNAVSSDGCSSVCLLESGFTCGAPGSPCAPICGGGVVVGAEGCDDGNTASGDGCSSACTVEAGYVCGIADTLEPRSVCIRPPVLVTPADGAHTTDRRPAISGTAAPGSVVTIVIDGVEVGTASADASGNWSFVPTSDLAEGTHTIEPVIHQGLVTAAGAAHDVTIDPPVPDAGMPDAGGAMDAGPEAGVRDAGWVDGDLPRIDAATPVDAPELMPVDGGMELPDAPLGRDAGAIDAGPAIPPVDGSCHCRAGRHRSSPLGVLGAALGVALLARARRPRRRR